VTSCPAAEKQKTPAAETSPHVRELTIRNVTKMPVTYHIRPFDSDARAQTKTVPPGAIDRYPGTKAMDIWFHRGGKKITYRLDPGRPYSFRYNEHNQVELYQGAHGRPDAPDLAPWVPTPPAIVDRMLELAQVGPRDVVFDLGCGDGRIVIEAARKFGARGVGVDIDPQRIKECIAGAKKAKVEKLVEFRLADATKVDVSSATVLALYLLTESNALLRPRLEEQLKPNTRVVAHDYPVPGWKAKKIVRVQDETGKEHTLFLYIR